MAETAITVVLDPPSAERPWQTWRTVGLAPRPEIVTYSEELDSDSDDLWPRELLELLASWVLDSDGLPGPGVALSLGLPLVEGSALEAVILLPPYFEQPGAPLLWALPITADELELTLWAGAPALEERLVAADLTPAPDLWRASLV